jgi:hypothetical protein
MAIAGRCISSETKQMFHAVEVSVRSFPTNFSRRPEVTVLRFLNPLWISEQSWIRSTPFLHPRMKTGDRFLERRLSRLLLWRRLLSGFAPQSFSVFHFFEPRLQCRLCRFLSRTFFFNRFWRLRLNSRRQLRSCDCWWRRYWRLFPMEGGSFDTVLAVVLISQSH